MFWCIALQPSLKYRAVAQSVIAKPRYSSASATQVVETIARASAAMVGQTAQRRTMFTFRSMPRLIPTRANGQPAFGVYVLDPQAGIWHTSGVLVLTLAGDKICGTTGFDTSVPPYFGLPRTLPNR